MDWIKAIKIDENKYLKELYTNYRGSLLNRFKKDFSLEEDEAVDIFQLTIIILFENISSGKLTHLDTPVENYLYGIGRLKSLELLRDKSKKEKFQKESIIDLVFESNENIILETKVDTILKSLDILGEPCRKLLELYYYRNKSMQEIAVEMGHNNADTSKTQKYKCLKRLQSIVFSHYKID